MIKRILNSPTMMSWASNIVRFGSAIFVLPLLLKVYSPIEQSFWFFLNTIIGFAMLADSGFGSTLVRAVSYFNAGADYLPKNKKEYDEIEGIKSGDPSYPKLKNLLTTSNRVYIYLGLFTILLLMTGGISATWNILDLSGQRVDFWVAYLILIPSCYMMVVSVKWSSFMRGLGYIVEEAQTGVVLGVFKLLAFIVLLLFQLSPAYLVFIVLIETVVKYFYFKRFVKRWFKKNGIKISDNKYFDKEIFTSLWSATWRTGLLFWGAYAVQYGTSILASQMDDAVMMANFLLTMRMIAFAMNIARSPFYANVPKIYDLAAQKKTVEMRKKVSGYMFLGLSVFVVALTIIAIFGNPVLDLLNIETRFIPLQLLIIIAVTELLDLHASYHATIYTSTNHVPFVIPALVSGGLLLLVGFNVLPVYGLLGIVVTKFVIQFMFNNWYAPFISLRLLKWKKINYLYQFPYYGILYIRDIIYVSVLNRNASS